MGGGGGCVAEMMSSTGECKPETLANFNVIGHREKSSQRQSNKGCVAVATVWYGITDNKKGPRSTGEKYYSASRFVQ